jgi:hypothetical protein
MKRCLLGLVNISAITEKNNNGTNKKAEILEAHHGKYIM